MNSNWETNKRVVATIVVILSILASALLLDVDTRRGWAVVVMITLTAGAMLLYFTRALTQTTTEAIHEARR